MISVYAASKGALAQQTSATSLEVIDHGIRFNLVGSGDAVTNITNHLHEHCLAFQARQELAD